MGMDFNQINILGVFRVFNLKLFSRKTNQMSMSMRIKIVGVIAIFAREDENIQQPD